MGKCPFCATDNAAGSKFCRQCGQPLDPALLLPLRGPVPHGDSTVLLSRSPAKLQQAPLRSAPLDKLFEKFDYLLLPSAQVFPFDANVHWPKSINGVAMDTYHRWMEVVIPGSMSGGPIINVPVGFGSVGSNGDGLPMGMQIIGKHLADFSVLQFAYAYEQATHWVRNHLPPLLKQ